MEKDSYIGIIILLAIVGIAIFGGGKAMKNSGGFMFNTQTPQQQKQADIQKQIQEAQKKVNDLEKQIAAQNDSKYKGIVTIQFVNHSNNIKSEYLVMRVASNATTTVPITGWTFHSVPSGNSVSIPKGTQLFFSGVKNIEDTIVLYPGDTAYVITGISPNGSSFRINKCTGYLSQFQTFTPYISTSCPLPINEDLSSIPKTSINDACFDYIDSYPACKTQINNLPNSWGYECRKFLVDKMNYSSCVNDHKSDKNFYLKDWRIYLGRSNPLWKTKREDIILYDNDGKVVDELKY